MNDREKEIILRQKTVEDVYNLLYSEFYANAIGHFTIYNDIQLCDILTTYFEKMNIEYKLLEYIVSEGIMMINKDEEELWINTANSMYPVFELDGRWHLFMFESFYGMCRMLQYKDSYGIIPLTNKDNELIRKADETFTKVYHIENESALHIAIEVKAKDEDMVTKILEEQKEIILRMDKSKYNKLDISEDSFCLGEMQTSIDLDVDKYFTWEDE